MLRCATLHKRSFLTVPVFRCWHCYGVRAHVSTVAHFTSCGTDDALAEGPQYACDTDDALAEGPQYATDEEVREKTPIILPNNAGDRWQLNTYAPYTCGFELKKKKIFNGAWLYGVHRTCAEMVAVSRGHQPCNNQTALVNSRYPLRWIFRIALCKATVTHWQSLSESAGKQKIALCKTDQSSAIMKCRD